MPTVGPITTTTVPIVYDTDNNGLGGPLNMAGATIGNVTYHQEPDGSLVLAFTLEFAQPNTRYTVYFVCGPAHASGAGSCPSGLSALTPSALRALLSRCPSPICRMHPSGPATATTTSTSSRKEPPSAAAWRPVPSTTLFAPRGRDLHSQNTPSSVRNAARQEIR